MINIIVYMEFIDHTKKDVLVYNALFLFFGLVAKKGAAALFGWCNSSFRINFMRYSQIWYNEIIR